VLFERHSIAGPFHDNQWHEFESLEGRESSAAREALATSTNGPAIVGLSGIDHFVIKVSTRRTTHMSKLLPTSRHVVSAKVISRPNR